jgi:phytoene synthase
MEASLDDPAIPLNRLAVGTDEARRMLSAFRQDAQQAATPTGPAGGPSAPAAPNPVGRMLLRLHGAASPLAAARRMGCAPPCRSSTICRPGGTASAGPCHLPPGLARPRRRRGRLFAPCNHETPRNPGRRADRVEELLDRASALPRLCAAPAGDAGGRDHRPRPR